MRSTFSPIYVLSQRCELSRVYCYLICLMLRNKSLILETLLGPVNTTKPRCVMESQSGIRPHNPVITLN